MGSFKILGRTSVDIIKSGGYKIGALDIERVFLEHPNVKDIAVCGVSDDTYGQKVGAVIVLSEKETSLELNELRDWAKNRMPLYEEISHIPLFFYHPKYSNKAGQRRKSLTQTIDLMPNLYINI